MAFVAAPLSAGCLAGGRPVRKAWVGARVVTPAAARRRVRAARRGAPRMDAVAPDASAVPAELMQTGEPFTDKAVNTIRFLAIDAVEKAQSGHPGMPMGMAPTAFALWDRHLKFNPVNPSFINRDRFVLSAGHGSMLLYALLYLYGFDSVSMKDIQQFRQLNSQTPGHPESNDTPGVEVTTGPLGQGICNAVGMAIAEAHAAAIYNTDEYTIVDNYTYCIMGDGCVMEGMSAEACSLAGHLKLGKLIAIYDDNSISIGTLLVSAGRWGLPVQRLLVAVAPDDHLLECVTRCTDSMFFFFMTAPVVFFFVYPYSAASDGSTDLAMSEDTSDRYRSYGWQVIDVPNGNSDLGSIEKAIEEAKACTDKPSLINIVTTIGFGSPNKANTAASHGSALGEDEVALTREALNWPYKAFEVPDEVLTHCRQKVETGAALQADWEAQFARYKEAEPEKAAAFESAVVEGALPGDWEEKMQAFAADADGMPTRKASAGLLQILAAALPNLLGGSADLAPSNLTLIEDSTDFSATDRTGKNIRYGVREHAMAAATTGIMASGYGLRPYCATFTIFTDYCKAAMRLAALSHFGVLYVTTHDSVGCGEDGPTHQSIEQLPTFRAMPNMQVFRPADATETAAAYAVALHAKTTPTLLVLTRQGTGKLAEGSYDGAKRGGYVLSDNSPDGEAPQLVLIATGSEVDVIVGAAERLRGDGITVRTVSLPCWEVFEAQSAEYKESVLPPAVGRERRLSVEAAASFGWSRYADHFVSIEQFGRSGPGDEVLAYFGFTPEAVADRARALV